MPLICHFGSSAGGDTYDSARFTSRAETARLVETPGLLIGRDPKSGKPQRYGGPSRLLTMAPTRTGKGVGTIILNLLTLDRSIVCIDPKGENARISSRARGRFRAGACARYLWCQRVGFIGFQSAFWPRSGQPRRRRGNRQPAEAEANYYRQLAEKTGTPVSL